MKRLLVIVLLISAITSSLAFAQEPSLKVVYPPANHKTSAQKIFFLGTAPSTGEVSINSKPIARSHSGHFAPSFPLELGKNLFTVRYREQEVKIQVTRVLTQPELPQGLAFAKDSLSPATDIAKLPGEPICFSAIAATGASVSVKLGNQTISLLPQPQLSQQPAKSAPLSSQNQSTNELKAVKYAGCTTVATSANLGQPQFQLTLDGKTITQTGSGKIQFLSPAQMEVVEVTADSGVARTAAGTDYSRLTPLPKGTQAAVTGREGEWLRLDYGAWINSKETRTIPGAIPPRTTIRTVEYRKRPGVTELIFPLQVPVPVSVQQGDRTFTLTLHNATAQTDIFRLDDDPLISRLDWQQVSPEQVKYTFNLKKDQQWGYKLRYEGTSLVLALRHAPANTGVKQSKPLSGIKLLLDPGHGGKESGTSGPTGYVEKDATLIVSKLVRDELEKRGATVVMTREDDTEVSLPNRVAMINKEEPTIALSIHYNSIPEQSDAENIKGMGAFWYHPQAHSLAVFMQKYIVDKLGRPSYGVFWNNLALTRPTNAPSVLLELGFMSNPNEFEWVVNTQEQKKLAKTIADGITEWFDKLSST